MGHSCLGGSHPGIGDLRKPSVLVLGGLPLTLGSVVGPFAAFGPATRGVAWPGLVLHSTPVLWGAGWGGGYSLPSGTSASFPGAAGLTTQHGSRNRDPTSGPANTGHLSRWFGADKNLSQTKQR